MTSCEFLFNNERYVGFEFYGHIGLGTKGNDVVCAAISAITQATIMGLKEVLEEKIEYKVEDGMINCRLESNGECAQRMLETLHKTLKQLSLQYPKNLSVSEMEV